MDESTAREILKRSREEIDKIDRDILDLIAARISLAGRSSRPRGCWAWIYWTLKGSAR